MKAVILGAKGAGRLCLDTLKNSPEAGNVEVIGFIDDNPALQSRHVSGIPVLGTYTQLPELISKHNVGGFLIGFSDNLMRLREERFNQCRELGLKPINIIHKSAMIAPSVSLGEGVFIGTGVMMELEVKIGDNCSIQMGSTIGHDCVLEKNVWLSGGVNLAGAVTVGKNTTFGTGANVIPQCHIGRDVIVGAGAVVINDVPEGVTVVGVPARIIKTREQNDNSV